MEVKIGITDSPRELVFTSSQAPDELEKLARASDAVLRSVGDREIVNVIVKAPRVVNIATKG